MSSRVWTRQLNLKPFSSLGGIRSREYKTESIPSEVLSQSMKTFPYFFLHAGVTLLEHSHRLTLLILQLPTSTVLLQL